MKLMKKLSGVRGTSLLEILVALAITGVVTTAIFKAYVTQHKNYLIQEDVTDIQQNARASIDELAKHIRMAGFDLPLGLQAIVPSNTNPDTITLTYRSDNCETTLSAAMGSMSAELQCGSDVSCFYDGQWGYIFEPDSGMGEWFEISSVDAGANRLQHTASVLSRNYGVGAQVLSMNEIKFFVDATTDTDHPMLMVQLPGSTPQPYAENISDMQFQYRLKNGVLSDEPVLVDDIREVLISVTGRSNTADADRAQDDGFRLRTFATSVFLRNVGL